MILLCNVLGARWSRCFLARQVGPLKPETSDDLASSATVLVKEKVTSVIYHNEQPRESRIKTSRRLRKDGS